MKMARKQTLFLLKPKPWNSRIFILFLFFALFSLSADDPGQLPSEKFLKIARNPHGSNHWATMEGKAIHRRKEKPVVEAPIYIAIRFTDERTIRISCIDTW